jgi:hypothetical protein
MSVAKNLLILSGEQWKIITRSEFFEQVYQFFDSSALIYIALSFQAGKPYFCKFAAINAMRYAKNSGN